MSHRNPGSTVLSMRKTTLGNSMSHHHRDTGNHNHGAPFSPKSRLNSSVGPGSGGGHGPGSRIDTGLGNPASGNSSAVKEKKFSLLYRDVLDCASHVLKSKDEFQEKYRDTQDRIGKSEILVREMILELEEEFKNRMSTLQKSLETKIVTVQEYSKNLTSEEGQSREAGHFRLEKGLERMSSELKEWNAEFCREIASKCDDEISSAKALATSEGEKSRRLTGKVEERLKADFLQSENQIKDFCKELRKSLELQRYEDERKTKQLQTRCTKLEEGLGNTCKNLEESDSSVNEKFRYFEAKLEGFERGVNDELSEIKSKLSDIEKRFERVEGNQIPFLLEKTEVIDNRLDEATTSLKEKIDQDISNVVSTVEVIKERQSRWNSKTDTLIKEEQDNLLNLKSQFELGLKKSDELSQQRSQAAVEYLKSDYIEVLRLDLENLSKDVESRCTEIHDHYSAKHSDSMTQKKELERQLTDKLNLLTDELRRENNERNTNLEEQQARNDMIINEVRKSESMLKGMITELSEGTECRMKEMNGESETRYDSISQNLDSTRRDFLNELKKSAHSLTEKLDFNVEELHGKLEKLRIQEACTNDGLKNFQQQNEQTFTDLQESLDSGIKDIKKVLSNTIEPRIENCENGLQSQREALEISADDLKRHIAGKITEWATKIDSKVNNEIKEVSRTVESSLLNVGEKQEGLIGEVNGLNRILNKVQQQIQINEKSASEIREKDNEHHKQNIDNTLNKFKQFEKKVGMIERDVSILANDSLKQCELNIEQTGFKLRKHIEDQIRVCRDQQSEQIYEVKSQMEHVENEVSRQKTSLAGISGGNNVQNSTLSDMVAKVGNLEKRVIEIASNNNIGAGGSNQNQIQNHSNNLDSSATTLLRTTIGGPMSGRNYHIGNNNHNELQSNRNNLNCSENVSVEILNRSMNNTNTYNNAMNSPGGLSNNYPTLLKSDSGIGNSSSNNNMFNTGNNFHSKSGTPK